MEELWNKNIEDKFNPGWINILDKSMVEWFNNYSPGFMCVDRKPHTSGNERHVIFYCLMSILWRAHIVEGKYCPSQRGAKQQQKIDKKFGLMLRMSKPIFGSGKSVVFDSGFCVAKGIVGLEDRGVYGGVLIKKRRYWPRNVPESDIGKHFEGKYVGSVDCLEMNADGTKDSFEHS